MEQRPPRLTRRRFLQAVGAVGGAAAVLGSMEALRLVATASEHRAPFIPPRQSDFSLHKIHGDAYVSEFLSSFSQHWSRERYSGGGWVEWPDRTSPAGDAMYRRLLEPQGRLYLAGDHMSHVTSWQHGAFESARAVVTQLHQRVLAG